MSAEGVRALTIRQPWASLIAAGMKTIETRSWSTRYRGPLLIHAGKWWPPHCTTVGRWQVLRQADGVTRLCGPPYFDLVPMPAIHLGAVVAVVDLVDVVRIRDGSPWTEEERKGNGLVIDRCGICESPTPGFALCENSGWTEDWYDGPLWTYHDDQIPLGDFTPGRYAWLLDNVRPIDPIPAKGRQGLWTPDESLVPAGLSEGGERA